jgi:hypothetical protein
VDQQAMPSTGQAEERCASPSVTAAAMLRAAVRSCRCRWPCRFRATATPLLAARAIRQTPAWTACDRTAFTTASDALVGGDRCLAAARDGHTARQ